MATFVLDDVPNVMASVVFNTAAGNPARVDGVPVWTNSDSSVAEMTVSPDGLTASFRGLAAGTTSITVTADADLGEGVTPLIGTGLLEYVPGQAVAAVINFAPAPVA